MTYIDTQVLTRSGMVAVQVALISAYLRPHNLMYKAMHTDYSEIPLTKEISEGKIPSEEQCSHIIIKKLLKGNRGHFGVLEHCPLIFHLKGLNSSMLTAFKEIPSVVIREYPQGSNVVYLKCNVRSFLTMMDYWIRKGVQHETLETCFISMWQLFSEYVPTIAEWYRSEREPLLKRNFQPIF